MTLIPRLQTVKGLVCRKLQASWKALERPGMERKKFTYFAEFEVGREYIKMDTRNVSCVRKALLYITSFG